MQPIFFYTTALAALISGVLYFFLKKGPKLMATSILAPLGLLFIYLFLARDEFGTSTLIFVIGACYCLVGSVFGTFFAKFIKK